MTQLKAVHYTRRDAANKNDATAYIQNVLRLSNALGWSQSDDLMTTFHYFDPGLQRDLDPPTSLNQFIQQVKLRQGAWFQVYTGYGSKSQLNQSNQTFSALSEPPTNQISRPQQSYQSSRPNQVSRTPQYLANRPSYLNQPNQLRQITAGPPPPPQLRVYWTDQDQEEDMIYDPPSDAQIATPEQHGPGHTPRRWGNTHDVGGSEALANWTSAGDDHRCSHEGCTHYH